MLDNMNDTSLAYCAVISDARASEIQICKDLPIQNWSDPADVLRKWG